MNVDFKTLKAKVGIDEVAYSLGYRIDKNKGLGRYIEMALPDGSDKIVIKNPQDKAQQLYFRHNGQKGGDVVSFVLENLHRFPHRSDNRWAAVTEILADFSGTPVADRNQYMEGHTLKGAQTFVPSRYEVHPLSHHPSVVEKIVSVRGISGATLQDFAKKVVLLKDLGNDKFDSYNIAFPYTHPGSSEIVGYETRGFNGFKGKVAGTDSTTAAWIVDLSADKNPLTKQHVFFCESAFDALAFYQMNRSQLDPESSVFVSIGGTFSDRQIRGIMQHYSNAVAVDCFDNDLAGRIYGIRLLCLLNGLSLKSIPDDIGVRLKIGAAERSYAEKELLPSKIAQDFRLSVKIARWKAPSKFKDWNDALLGKAIRQESKYEQARQLRKNRLKR